MTVARERDRLVAAPLLGDRGGGVGQVSTLLWRVVSEAWDRARLVELVGDGHRIAPTAADKLRFGARLAAHALVDRPAWVLFTHLGLARTLRTLPRRLMAPYAVFLHGMEAWHPLGDADRAVLRGAALRMVNSRFTASRVEATNADLGPIAVCPLALPPDFRAASSARAVRHDDPVILTVGRMAASERYKGHEQLLRAWPFVFARVSRARLILAGDGDDAPRLRALAASLPGAARIRFTGFVPREHLNRLYATAAVFGLPSRAEGFGLVYLEAMAHGLPCIGSTADAAGEVIVDGVTGALVDCDRPDQLAHALVSLLEDPGRARSMGEAGRIRVRETFSYAAFRHRVVTLLRAAFDDAAGQVGA